jgi:hypothetical protein
MNQCWNKKAMIVAARECGGFVLAGATFVHWKDMVLYYKNV